MHKSGPANIATDTRRVLSGPVLSSSRHCAAGNRQHGANIGPPAVADGLEQPV
jgi:hypothetical protein